MAIQQSHRQVHRMRELFSSVRYFQATHADI
jgi:hypothetical protein